MAERILVPIDTHEESSWRDVLPVAVAQAGLDGGTLHVMTVVEHVEVNLPGVPAPQEISRKRRDQAARKLAELTRGSVPAEVPCETTAVVGNVHREILRQAEQVRADLIIMASHRPQLSDYLLGAHAARVVRHAQCSVYVVRPGGY